MRTVARVLCVALVGCADDLPLREHITSIRPLAVRIEVVEPRPEDAPVRLEALPTERVRLIPWIVDQRGPASDEALDDLDPVWLACPLRPAEGLFACLSAHGAIALEDISSCPEPTFGDFANIEGVELPPSPCRMTGGTPTQPELVVPLHPNFLVGGDLEVTMIGHTGATSSTAACTAQLLQGADELSENCMYVTQRVPVGPDALLLRLAVEHGLVSAEQLGPIPETIPEPDANPRIQSFRVTVHDGSEGALGTFDVARGDVLELPAGARLEIETQAPESDLQTYLVPLDGETFVERRETYRGLWFRTWGDLLSGRSNDPLSFNTWTLVAGRHDATPLPPGGRATLYYVLRDDRQGVDWWWFHIDVDGG